MNYQNIYDNLINKCVVRNWSKKSAPCYTEKHHVLPKCLGGTNESTNLVVLSAREHYIAHLLLAKIHGGKLWYALKVMSNNGESRGVTKITGSMYEKARSKISKLMSAVNTGRVRSDETKALISKNHSKCWLGRKHTEEFKAETSNRQKGSKNHNYGKKASEETRAKMSKIRTGRKHTKESILKMKGRSGKLSHHFSGYYHTDLGKFASTRLAAKVVGCSPSTILRRIHSDNFPNYRFESAKMERA